MLGIVSWIVFCFHVGNREIVGPGMHGEPLYEDRHDYPMPSMRFMNPSPEIAALQAKEKGDWNNLTIDEKKACMWCGIKLDFISRYFWDISWHLQKDSAQRKHTHIQTVTLCTNVQQTQHNRHWKYATETIFQRADHGLAAICNSLTKIFKDWLTTQLNF